MTKRDTQRDDWLRRAAALTMPHCHRADVPANRLGRFPVLVIASLVWLPATRRWNARAHLCWSMNFSLKDYAPAALPVQVPVPMLLGGGGPRMTRFAGRHADIIGFDPMSLPEGGKNQREFGRPAFEAKLRVLEDACAGRGDRGPERSILVFHVARRVEELPEDSWVDPQLAGDPPYALIGDTSAMVETLLEQRERWGITYYVCFDQDFDVLRPVVAALAGA